MDVSEKIPLVIYHGHCVDGFTAAWAARRSIISNGGDAEFFGARYPIGDGDTELPDVTGRNVYMLDFCVSREQLLRLNDEAESLLVLDHHATHQEACDGLSFCQFDMDRSGAGMTWDHFHGVSRVEKSRGFDGVLKLDVKFSRPWLVDYVQDRDLWTWKLPDSKIVSAFIGCQEKTWANWDAMAAMDINEALVLGRGAKAHLDAYVRSVVKMARRVSFPKNPGVWVKEGLVGTGGPNDYYTDIPVVNATGGAISEVAGKLAEDALFAVGWWQRADGMYVYSLRSRGGDDVFDVSKLAKEFGGGGHAQAAGFTAEHVVFD